MGIASRLQQEILPGRVLSVQVGFSRTAVMAETDEGIRCGLAATLTNPDVSHRVRPPVRQAGHLLEMDYRELAALSESESFTEVAIGLATINALLPRQPEAWQDIKGEDYIIEHGAGKNVTLVGHFPFSDRLRQHVKNLWVLELNPCEGDLPAQAAPEVIPQSDFLAITATTLINKTFEDLISLRRAGAVVIMIGPSTPLSPVMYEYGVHVLSGAVVQDPHAAVLGISQGISLHQLRHAGHIRFVTMGKI